MNKNRQERYFFDSASIEKEAVYFIPFPGTQKVIQNFQSGKIKSTLFSRSRRMECFFTEDSKLYITPKEKKLMESGVIFNKVIKGLDSLNRRILKSYQPGRPKSGDILYKTFAKHRQALREAVSGRPVFIASRWPLAQIWNMSIISAVLLGMISMALIYHYLGLSASARDVSQAAQYQDPSGTTGLVLGEETLVLNSAGFDISGEENGEYIANLIRDLESAKKEEFEKEIRKMVKGYPIEKMIPYIVKKDRIVAAFLIGIARKESSWGVHVPLLAGQDCYNYWGYREQRRLMGTGGHTCFNSPKDAVDTVAKRLEWLIKNKKLNTPTKMVIWKCGSACDKDDVAAVRKWISDVSMYFEKLNN
ncbi:MAG: hypothetical protein NT136_02485 [Candidatus Moranbacteria bacterium]|nr:hypothetical protein [Candidatus Moranbacteria bacterium]